VAVAFDRAAAPGIPLAVRVALDEAGARGARPTQVRVHPEGDAPLPDLARWSEESALAFRAGGRWEDIAAGAFPRGTIDLLQGELAPGADEPSRFRLPRAAVALAIVIASLQFLFTALDAWRLSRRHAELTARQEAIFRGAFPDARAIVDPGLQMARNLSRLKRERGLAADDDFLAQATHAAREFPAGGARAITYANGRLEVRRGENLAEAKP